MKSRKSRAQTRATRMADGRYLSRSLSYVGIIGGGKRDRTADLLHAMQALSQLSYTPGKPREIIRSDVCEVKSTGLTRVSAQATDSGSAAGECIWSATRGNC
jgi:hypothetical protein